MTYDTATGAHFTLTAADVVDGCNRLGMDVRHVPLDVSLCSGCDQPVVNGVCDDCQTIHTDLLPELRAENKGKWA